MSTLNENETIALLADLDWATDLLKEGNTRRTAIVINALRGYIEDKLKEHTKQYISVDFD